MRALVALADRVLVMHHGAQLFLGTPAEMLRDERVIEVYLGRARPQEATDERSAARRAAASDGRLRAARWWCASCRPGGRRGHDGGRDPARTATARRPCCAASAGCCKPQAGEVTLDGERHRRAAGRGDRRRAGIVHILQGDGLFPDMTVEENLLMGAFPRPRWRGPPDDARSASTSASRSCTAKPRPEGAHALGRRAAAGRPRPRADASGPAAADRRAVARARAGGDRRRLRGDRADRASRSAPSSWSRRTSRHIGGRRGRACTSSRRAAIVRSG